ncbi:MAG: hypothetical protein V4598_13350 [Bdellovibrionota bacterium]
MKILFFLFIISAAMAQHHHGDMPSVHGMAIFGKKTIYLSHLPMFHAPHDYQAIMEAEFDPSAVTTYLGAQESETLFTLVPEEFSLPEMMNKPRPFKAQIFAGHFERGGKLITETTVKIKKVILFKKLNPTGQRPSKSTYYALGNAQEQFLIHKISARPDFDHIIQVKSNIGNTIEERTFPFPDSQPLVEGKEIYFETGDLSH